MRGRVYAGSRPRASGRLHDLAVREADDPPARGGEGGVALAVSLEGVARVVVGPAVQLDRDALCPPHRVDLEALDEAFGAGIGRPSRVRAAERHPRGRSRVAVTPERRVLGDRLPSSALWPRPSAASRARHRGLDRPQVEDVRCRSASLTPCARWSRGTVPARSTSVRATVVTGMPWTVVTSSGIEGRCVRWTRIPWRSLAGSPGGRHVDPDVVGRPQVMQRPPHRGGSARRPDPTASTAASQCPSRRSLVCPTA